MSMKRISVAALVATAASGCLTIPHLALAKSKSSHHVSIKLLTKQKGTVLTGTFSDKVLGHGTAKGTLHIPLTKLTYKVKGGSFSTTTPHCKTETYTPPTYTGCWKISKATGKFKGMTGSGTLSGNVDGHSIYKGTVKY